MIRRFPELLFVLQLHSYVSAHNGTFDGLEKNLLRTFFDARQVTLSEGELRLAAYSLRRLRNALE
jgi:hypothetical protein